MSEQPGDSTKKYIKFDDDSESDSDIQVNQQGKTRHEMLRDGDRLLIDTKYFEGQTQTDVHLCNYLVFTAQLCLANYRDRATHSYYKSQLLEGLGVKKIAELIRKEVGTEELSNWQQREELASRIGQSAHYIERLTDFSPDSKESVGQALLRMLEIDMAVGVMLGNEGHAVLAIGYSSDKSEIIVWDALMGRGNPRLRRINLNDPHLEVTTAVAVHPGFKSPA